MPTDILLLLLIKPSIVAIGQCNQYRYTGQWVVFEVAHTLIVFYIKLNPKTTQLIDTQGSSCQTH